jgi:hypothetical protein
MREIPLTHGAVAIVDDEDYLLVSRYRWVYVKRPSSTTGYAFSLDIYREMGKFLVDRPAGMEIDHVNGNGLDNRRSNLRICTSTENRRNRRKPRAPGASRFKGVRPRNEKWRAEIKINGEHRCLGTYASEEDAAKAYDAAARELHGEFACLNFPLPGERGALYGTDEKAV